MTFPFSVSHSFLLFLVLWAPPPFLCTDIFNYKWIQLSSHPVHTSGSWQTAASLYTAVWTHNCANIKISNQISQFFEDGLQLYSETEAHSASHCSAPVCRQHEVIFPFSWDSEHLGSISRTEFIDFCKWFTTVSQGNGLWSETACRRAVPSHCTAIGLIVQLKSSSKNDVIESGNLSQRQPWQHLSTIFVTVSSAAYVPSTHNGYSWFYAVQVTSTTMEFVRAWTQLQLFVTNHWCEPDVSWVQVYISAKTSDLL